MRVGRISFVTTAPRAWCAYYSGLLFQAQVNIVAWPRTCRQHERERVDTTHHKMPKYKQLLVCHKVDDSETYSTFVDENNSDADTRLSVGDAIEKIGFGWFQVFIGLIAGIAWVADGMEIMVVSVLGPVLICEWNIDVYEEAMLTTIVFLGFLIGSPIAGYIGDKFGRRHALMLSSLWISVYGLLTALATNLYWLYFLRFLVGLGIGGAPQVITYFSEFLPNKYRGSCLILTALPFSLGGSLTLVFAIYVLIPYGWRWWLAACSIPSIIYVVLCAVFGYWLEWMPRSPHFDIISNNSTNAEKTLKLIARCNKSAMPEGKLVAEDHVSNARVWDLCQPGFKLTSILLITLFFLVGLSYYGMVLFATELLAAGSTCKPDEIVALDNHTCTVFQKTDYVHLMMTSMAELPVLLITAVLIDKIGRKATLISENIIYGITCLFLFICMDGYAMIFLLFILRSIGLSSFEALLVYTPEFYPTEVRALSIGFGSVFSRIATMISPYVSQVLVSKSLYYGIGIYAAIGFLSSLATYLLPVETKDKSLNAHG